MATLTVNSGPSTGQAVEVDKVVVVGREGTDLVLSDSEISRTHASLRPADEGVEIEDLDSTNGTFVNGERVGGVTLLTADAEIRVGQTILRLELPAPVAPPGPDVTVQRPVADPDLTVQRPIPGPDVTAPRDVPAPDVTAPRDVPAPDVTAPRDIAGPDVTAPRSVPVEPAAEDPPRDTPAERTGARPAAPQPLLIAAIAVGVLLALILLVLVLG